MNHLAPARVASRAEGAVCVSWSTGSSPRSSISSKTSLNFIPVLGKDWIQVWSHWWLPYEFYSSKNQPSLHPSRGKGMSPGMQPQAAPSERPALQKPS